MEFKFASMLQDMEIPGDQVDVNVHPTKHEVVFLHQEEIITSISTTVEELLQGPVRYGTPATTCRDFLRFLR